MELFQCPRLISDSERNNPTEHHKLDAAQSLKDMMNRDRAPPGGPEPEDVEDDPNVGTVKPTGYPRVQAMPERRTQQAPRDGVTKERQNAGQQDRRGSPDRDRIGNSADKVRSYLKS